MSFSKWLTALACIMLMAADGLTVNTRLSATTRTAGALPTAGNETKTSLFNGAGRLTSVTRNVNDVSSSVI